MTLWTLGVVSLVGSVLATALSIPLARFCGIVDAPGAIKIHANPIPRFGGLGFVVVVLLVSLFLRPGLFAWSGALLMAAIGALDDVRNLTPKEKLLGEGTAAFLLAISFYCACDGGFFPAFLVLFLVVYMSNAVNLLDGRDGLAGWCVAIAAAGLAAIGTMTGSDPSLPVLLLGAVAGFLLWNLPPAKTFMGDMGSLFLGYVLTWSALDLVLFDAALLPAVLACLLVPLYDTTLGILRRLLTGRHLFEGDRDHFYDQLFRRFRSGHAVLGISWGLSVICAAYGLLLAFFPAFLAWIGLLLAIGALVVWTRRMGFLHPQRVEVL